MERPIKDVCRDLITLEQADEVKLCSYCNGYGLPQLDELCYESCYERQQHLRNILKELKDQLLCQKEI